MRAILTAGIIGMAALLATPGEAQATCRGQFLMDFGYTTPLQFTMSRDTSCMTTMNFEYVAFYGLSIRQQPRNGTLRITGKQTFVYTPRKGFTGTDLFVVDAEGAPSNWQSGNVGQRSKAGMAITMTVQ